MRRLVRILLHGAAVMSLLLCVASAVLWVRSYRVIDSVSWGTSEWRRRGCACESGLGIIRVAPRLRDLPEDEGQVRSTSEPLFPSLRSFHRRRIDIETWHGFAFHPGTFTDGHYSEFGWLPLFVLPCWFLFLCTAVLPAILLYRKLRSTRKPPGRCAQCGYDLRATPERCPECGTIPLTAAPTAPPGGP